MKLEGVHHVTAITAAAQPNVDFYVGVMGLRLVKQLELPFKLGLGGPIAGGEQFLSWIHVDDEVAMVLWALDNEKVSGVINASAPHAVTNREFSKALGRALHRPFFLTIPKFAVAAVRGRGGDRGDVVDALELHRRP